MRNLFVGLSAFWFMIAAPVHSEPVAVVELFTSQGCSSCPPADRILTDLAKRDDVIALAYHVDYWDYLGWVDKFASPQFSALQRAYARAAGERSVYTPQAIVGGKDHVIGSRPTKISNAVRQHLATPEQVDVALTRKNGTVQVSAEFKKPVRGDFVVYLVTIIPDATVAIKRGENAGRTVTYSNIVRERFSLGSWNGRSAFQTSARVSDDTPVAVLVQHANAGPIVGAAQLR